MIRLFVIEDHLTVIVSSFRYLFRPKRDGIIVSGFATSVEDAIKIADSESLDLFVLDLYLPGHLPIDNIRKLKKHFPDKPVVIYTSEQAAYWRKRMIDEGAITYITKDSTREELKFAIQKAARGESVIYGQMESIDQINLPDPSISGLPKITPVEREIFKLLSVGLTHKEISEQLGISRSMIEKILGALRKSFKAKNNYELSKILTHSGLIEGPLT